MTLNLDVPWHRESFDLFVHQRLPRLLGERLPLADYRVEQQGPYTFSIKLSLGLGDASVEVEYRDLPRPDRDGLFRIEGNYRIVVPYPDRRELEQARILCVGEQLCDFIDQRLEAAPEQLAWDGDLVRNWLPLDAWMRDFHLEETSQYLQATNWLDRYTHLRRLVVASFDSQDVFPYCQYGLVCPYCTPEGPNIGRVLEVAPRGPHPRRQARTDRPSARQHFGFFGLHGPLPRTRRYQSRPDGRQYDAPVDERGRYRGTGPLHGLVPPAVRPALGLQGQQTRASPSTDRVRARSPRLLGWLQSADRLHHVGRRHV